MKIHTVFSFNLQRIMLHSRELLRWSHYSVWINSHTVLSLDLLRLTLSSVWIYRGSHCPQSGFTENDTVLYLDLKRFTSGSTENHTAFTLDLHTTYTGSGISYDTTTSSDLLTCTLSDVQNYIKTKTKQDYQMNQQTWTSPTDVNFSQFIPAHITPFCFSHVSASIC